MNKYLAMTKLGKMRKMAKVIKMAQDNAVSCSMCGHGVRSHTVPNAENMSTLQLTKYLTSAIPAGSRKYCLGTVCRECEKKYEAYSALEIGERER